MHLPKGDRPNIYCRYVDEVWTGFEYEVAALMIAYGLTDEGLRIVSAARARHDGLKRNPWDEFECGHHYARAMSSYALIHALVGFAFSAVDKTLTFAPRINTDDYTTFFATPNAWGQIVQTVKKGVAKLKITCHQGQLELKNLLWTVPLETIAPSKSLKSRATIEKTIKRKHTTLAIRFRSDQVVTVGKVLTLSC